MKQSEVFSLRISGDFALFTRPEMKAERVSYDVITPSGARGVVEAILWKPAIRWRVHRIGVLRPIRFISVRRNEVGSKISLDRAREGLAGEEPRPYLAGDDRRQRNAVMLRDVAYRVEVSFELTKRASGDDSVIKFTEMFKRRIRRGQHFHQPYLGCREFPATVTWANDDEPPHETFGGMAHDLGWILLDMDHREKPPRPLFFHAVMHDGYIDVPNLEEVVA